MRKLLSIATLFCCVVVAHARIILPPLIGDRMVLQQQDDIILRGHASGKNVCFSASWIDGEIEVPVLDGKFEVQIKTPVASRNPQIMTFRDKDSEIVISDILIGEVWICSGQSNMEMTMRGFSGQPIKESLQAVMQSSKYSDLVHVFSVSRVVAERPRPTARGQWIKASPDKIMNVSATAYHFAVALADALQIPVGVITASRSSSAIEAWMPKEILKEQFGYDVEAINANPDIRDVAKCGMYYNGMLVPLFGYSARGFLWYQGESNRHAPEKYPSLMEAMVKDWRKNWGDTDNQMPFIFVQIAPYSYGNVNGVEVPRIVEAQVKSLELIPNSAIVATTDIGEENCIHPSDKKTVGMRAAVEALRLSYGIDIPDASGMMCTKVEYSPDKVVLSFKNASYGFTPVDEVRGFELSGTDGRFYPAVVEVAKNKKSLILTSAHVAQPVGVRYAYKNWPECNLKNSLGYPLLPFCDVRNPQ